MTAKRLDLMTPKAHDAKLDKARALLPTVFPYAPCSMPPLTSHISHLISHIGELTLLVIVVWNLYCLTLYW
jgi:hypothetical protein